MIVDKIYVQNLRNDGRHGIPVELEEILINRFGEEPSPYTYSEQDLYEQIRKVINRYETPRGRLEILYGVDLLENQLNSLNLQITSELMDSVVENSDF
jgi:hypothetical protein